MQRMVGLGFALLALAGPVAAQTPVGVRESVNGALEAGDRAGADGRLYDCYRLPADPDRWLAASLMSQDFDAVLGAGQGPSCGVGEAIRNDDSGTGPHARVHLPPREGDWFIRVSAYDAGETGDYFFRIAPVDGPPEPPAGGPNPFRNGTAELSLPFHAQDWVRPRDPAMRYRWDAMCMAVNWVARHERVALPIAPREQVERETARLAAALADSARLAGHTEAETEATWRPWIGAAMSLTHDAGMAPHPLTAPLQRACVKQLAAADQAEGSSAPANAR